MPSYQLVNPYIEGDFEKVFSGSTPLEVAEKTWNKLSKYLTSNVPKFAFSMERTSDGRLFHFMIKEKNNNGTVDFSVESVNLNLPTKVSKEFKNKIGNIKVKQAGGKKQSNKKKNKDDSESSDSSDSDSSDYYAKLWKKQRNNLNQPIVYWWYTPYIYEPVVGSVFIPNFVVPLTPYVEIYSMGSTFWY